MRHKDLELLRISLLQLKPREQLAIHLRYWERFTIEEISHQLRMSWDDTDKFIEKILYELKTKIKTTALRAA